MTAEEDLAEKAGEVALLDQITDILVREIPGAGEYQWYDDAAVAIRALIIKTYGPPF